MNTNDEPILFMEFLNQKNVQQLPINLHKLALHELQKKYFETAYHSFDLIDNFDNLDANFLITIKKNNSISCVLFLFIHDNIRYNLLLYNDTLYMINIKFANNIYDTTVFVGYLYKRKNKYVYAIEDIVTYCNKIMAYDDLIHRLRKINNIIKNELKNDSKSNTCEIELVGYFLYNHFPFIKTSCFLKFKAYSIIYHYHYIIEKEHQITKKIDNKLLDIYKTNITDVYKIGNNHKNNHKILTVTSTEMSNKLRDMFKSRVHNEILCEYDLFFHNWKILM